MRAHNGIRTLHDEALMMARHETPYGTMRAVSCGVPMMDGGHHRMECSYWQHIKILMPS